MEKEMHVTIVDDSKDNLDVFQGMLEKEFDLELIQSPLTVLDFLKKNKTDLIVLDLHMPVIDGFELYKRIKLAHPLSSIIFLTGDNSENSIVNGLNLGADDYIAKTVSSSELIARFKNKIHSRQSMPTSMDMQVIKFDGFILHSESQAAEINNVKIQLTPIEFKFIYLLAKNPNKVFSREYVTDYIWPNVQVQNQNIDTHLSNLRKKLVPFSRFIKTIKSRGYILRVG
jgi:two-component system phosphate regulon response regulator PhoB